MADGAHGGGGHETPSSNEHSAQNFVAPIVGGLGEMVTHFMSDIAQTALDLPVKTGTDLASNMQSGGSQPNKGGGSSGGGGGGHH